MLLIQKYQMEQRISELERNHDYKEGVRQTCRNNKVALTTLNGLTIKRLRVVYGRTLKHYELNPEKAKQAWFENQLRLFHWVLLIESFLTKKPLNQFSAGQWETIQSYFPLKNPKIFQFEAKKLLGNDPATYSRSWLPEECELLCRIMDDQTLIKKWNEVARKFYELSRMRFFRTSKQCREQWLNHLDYSKIHGQWSQAEDKLILEFVLAHGRKWAQVCKEFLPKRTQHMIKNRFKSLLARGQQSSPAKTVNQRRMIKKILAKLKAEPKKEEKSCLIEKLPAYHSSRGEEREESQGSVASNSKLLLSGCAKINEQNIQSIINQQEQSQQNKKSVSGNPQRPSPFPVTYQSATNLSAPPGFGNLQTFMTQQTISQSLPFFTCNPFYPNFFTIVNPIIPFAPLEGNGTLRFFGENAFSN